METRTLLTAGPDPKLFVPQDLTGNPGDTITVPVKIDSIEDLTGSELYSADIIILFDPNVLTASSVTLGDVPNENPSAGWNAPGFNLDTPGRAIIGVSNQQGLGGTFAGSLILISFTIHAGAATGTTPVNLAASTTAPERVTSLNEGELTLTPAPTNAADDEVDGLVTILPGKLIVTSLTPTPSGFVAQFSREFQLPGLNLYDGAGGTLGPADVVLTDGAGQTVAGSMIVADNRQTIEFVKTGGVLTAGTYTVTIKSGGAAFRALDGDPLDGNDDGTTGDDFTGPLTVGSSAARIVSVPDMARGAGQSVSIPNTAAGLPLYLDNAAGVTSLAVDLVYAPGLLAITAATLAAGIPVDWSVRLDTGTPGVAKVTASGSTALSGPNVEVVRLTAAMPSAALYGAVQAIRLDNVTLNSGVIAAVGDVAVHKAVYLGDADGSGVHSSADAFLTVQAALGLASGFEAHAWTDPRIVGDADGSGVLSAADAFLIVQEGLGLAEPFVPDNPHITVTPVGSGVDPQFQIDVHIPASAGGLVTVPVNLVIEPAATNVGAFDFDLFFDPSRLTIELPEGVSVGADTAGWAVSAVLVAAGQLRVGMLSSTGQPLAPGLREIARLQFHVAASLRDAIPVSERPDYVVALDVEPVDPRAGGYTWTDADGSVAIVQGQPRAALGEKAVEEPLQDRIFGDEQMEFSPLETMLTDLTDDIGSACREAIPLAHAQPIAGVGRETSVWEGRRRPRMAWRYHG